MRHQMRKSKPKDILSVKNYMLNNEEEIEFEDQAENTKQEN